MHIAEIWRYPVKSLRGEQVDQAELLADGIAGDRLAHVREAGGRVVTSCYRPGLLALAGTVGDDGEPLIDGRPLDDPRSHAAVREASANDVEIFPYTAPDHGQRHDVLPLTVLTDGMACAVGVDHRRFRPNLLIGDVDGLAERDSPGRALRVGSAVIGVRNRRSRCVMTTFDPDTQEQDPSVLRHIVHEFAGEVALDCWVVESGLIAVGDTVELVPLPLGVLPA